MTSSCASTHGHLSSNETETNHLQFDGNDPYIDNLEDFRIEELFIDEPTTEEALIEVEDEEEDLLVVEDNNAEADDKLKPYVGMEFSDRDEAYHFYNRYARDLWFSVHKAREGMRMIKLHQLDSHVLEKRKEMPIGSCANQKTPEKDRGISRVGCNASCRVKLAGEVWQVSVFVEVHNHELIKSPSKNRNLRSHKRITPEDKEIIRALNAQNIGSSQIHEYLASQYGGKEFVTFKKKDINNQVTVENQKFLGVDVDTTVLHFQHRMDVDPEFFYLVDTDENGAVKNIFWADGRARRAYQEFGDVVTFDTTYQTNKYGMPLAPFIGVNHHRQSIFFGMALLRYEISTNFVWLFETWLEAMHGKHPNAIITDQDPAMRKAIKKVFPNTVHRCCQWHVMRNARDHLGRLYDQLDGFCEKMTMVINHCLTICDFETSWADMIEEYKLHENSHLKVMYNSRKEWVPAYFRDMFFANMSTTQRSESMNVVFKLWVTNKTSFYKFVLQIEKMSEGIWQKESDEDIRTMNERAQTWSPYLVEVQAREVYTRNVFSLFKGLVRESLLGFLIEIKKDMTYQVDITYHPSYKKWVPVSYVVELDKTNQMVSCTCKCFEVDGLLCPHAIKVMQHVNMSNLPSHYILKRWTKNANSNIKRCCSERSLDSGETKELQNLRFANLKSDLISLGKLGAMNVEAYNRLRYIITNSTKELGDLVGSTLNDANISNTVIVMDKHSQVSKESGVPSFIDPPKSQCKGRTKRPTRFKPAIEKYAKKMRKCSICNGKEGHNARTCPKRSSKSKKNKEAPSHEESSDTEEEQEDIEEEDEEQESN